jgi:hypothetical protein
VPPRPPVPSQASPRTSMTPPVAVRTPESSSRSTATALEERPIRVSLPPLPPLPGVGPAAAEPTAARSPLSSPAHPSRPVPDFPLSSSPVPNWADDEHDAPWVTGRGAVRAPRSGNGRPEVPPLAERRASRLPAGGVRPSTGSGDSSGYGDWTKPSGAGRVSAPAGTPAVPSPRAPSSGAVTGRSSAGRSSAGRGIAVADAPESIDDLPVASPGAAVPDAGPVGGRAAFRAERQAAEVARRKAAKRDGRPLPSALDEDDDEDGERRRPRRALKSVLAVAVLALGMLGFYWIASPETQETGARSTPVASAPPSTTAPVIALPPLVTEPAPVEEVPATPVRVPVTVLNATDVNGLAAAIASAIVAEGWESPAVGGYPNGDVAATTVYFTEGDEQQRQAAVQLVDQFPELSGPAPRFFEVPADVAAPGLVVVAAGDWQP